MRSSPKKPAKLGTQIGSATALTTLRLWRTANRSILRQAGASIVGDKPADKKHIHPAQVNTVKKNASEQPQITSELAQIPKKPAITAIELIDLKQNPQARQQSAIDEFIEDTFNLDDIIKKIAIYLQKVCDKNKDLKPANDPFLAVPPPKITIADYLERMKKYCDAESISFISMLLILKKYSEKPGNVINIFNIHRLMITALVLSMKIWQDKWYDNAWNAKIGGIPLKELNNLEVYLLEIDINVAMEQVSLFRIATELLGKDHKDLEKWREVLALTPEELKFEGSILEMGKYGIQASDFSKSEVKPGADQTQNLSDQPQQQNVSFEQVQKRIKLDEKNYYQVLGLNKNASEEQIKKAFKEIAVLMHPDKNPEKFVDAEELFKKIETAYSVLSDKQKRADYDHGYSSIRSSPKR